jgi:fumarylacetoacetate (FAA) hydrolase family protein
MNLHASLHPSTTLPADANQAVLVGRAWVHGQGAVLVRVTPEAVFDLSRLAPTMTHLLELDDPAAAVRKFQSPKLGDTAAILANSACDVRSAALPYLLAPCDLQAIKAAGVTFVASMLERVIEEQARGDASKAEAARAAVVAVIGENLSAVVPGSPEAARLKQVLLDQGLWSQYLEVGIGPDAEVFTKSQPMSAVGTGAEIGLHPGSEWNNPEPEIVLAVDSQGRTKGATLGNDVNLRDFEGRSALLLGKAKDNNGACAIGPFIRLFDAHFGIDDVRATVVSLRVEGEDDGFVLEGASSMAQISRDPLELVRHAMGAHHQYPDGILLFCGTMFAPIQDRDAPGAGFTHHVGDRVAIHAERLGTLVNRVGRSDVIPPWTFGIGALMHNLAARGLLSAPGAETRGVG